jgi:ABC-type transporter lipoprotein component MlaA
MMYALETGIMQKLSLTPLTKGYRARVPLPAQKAVGEFF